MEDHHEYLLRRFLRDLPGTPTLPPVKVEQSQNSYRSDHRFDNPGNILEHGASPPSDIWYYCDGVQVLWWRE